MNSASHKIALAVVPILLVGVVALYQLSVTASPLSYAGFSELEWAISDKCISEGGHRLLQPPERSVGTWIFGGGQNTGVCISKPMQALAQVVELDVAGYPSAEHGREVTIDLRLLDSGYVHSLDLPAPRQPEDAQHWYSRWFYVPGLKLGSEFALTVQDQANVDEAGWIALRDRVNFYNLQDNLFSLRQGLRTPAARLAIAVVLGLLITLFAFTAVCSNRSRVTLLTSLLFLSVSVLLRLDGFFYWDEWHAIERFLHQGWQTLAAAHNEHFIPLFFGLYFSELMLFRDSYLSFLLVSLLLHGLNAYLVARLLSRFASPSASASAARLCGVMFALSSISAEVTQWAFMQSVLAGTACSLGALIAGWDYVQRGRARKAVYCCAGLFAGPLFFGGSLIAVFQLLILLVILEPAVLSDGGRRDVGSSYVVGDRKKRLLIIAFVTWAFIGSVYLANQRQGALPGAGADLLANSPQSVFTFLIAGAELGGVLGGAGIFPLPEMQPPTPILPPSLAYLKADPALFGSVLLGALCAGVFVLWLLVKLIGGVSRRETLLLIVGQLLMFSALLLPALGRAQLGPSQALSMRYVYLALPWFFVFALPFIERIVQGVLQPQTIFSPVRPLCFMLIAGYFASHLLSLARYEYFTDHALRNRRYVAKLAEWYRLTPSDSHVVPGDFTARGAEFAGLYPAFPPRLAPDFSPEQVYEIVCRLNSAYCRPAPSIRSSGT